MKLEVMVIGSMETNCYFVINEESREMVIVDPALCPEGLLTHIREAGYLPKAIFLTHGHFDHIMGIDRLVEAFSIPVYFEEEEAEMLRTPRVNLSAKFATPYAFEGGIPVKDGQMLEVAGMNFKVIHTPGHTKGGCCYYLEEERTLISGDTLFYHCVGKTHFPTGNQEDMVRSVRGKLFALPDEVAVYPGHSEPTSIGEEKKCNPYV